MQNQQAHPARLSSPPGGPGLSRCWLALAGLLLVPGHLGAQSSMRIENVTWVANTGTGSAAELANCQALRDALASLPPFPRPDQLVILAPGRYACHTPVVVPTQVVLEGSGVNTVIHGGIDDSSTGLVALSYQTSLSRVFVWNTTQTPTQAAIAVSVTSPIGGAGVRLNDVTAVNFASSGTRHPLYVNGVGVEVYGGSYRGGTIRLTGSSHFTLYHAHFDSVIVEDPGVDARCYFFRLGGLGGEGSGCP